MQFLTPSALLLLLIALPLVWAIGFPRHAFRRRRDVSSLILRTIIVLLLALALAGMQLSQAVDRLAVVFLVDASDSMDAAAEAAQLAYIRAALSEKPVDDEWAVVAFGDNAVPERDFSRVDAFETMSSAPLPTQTDIANAIQTALSMFPPDTARRILLLSDGRATKGDAIARARRAAASDAQISIVPIERAPSPDVRVSVLDAPSRVPENQSFDIAVGIHAEASTPARLLLYSGGSLIHEEALDLPAGESRFAMTQTSESSGFLDFTAQIIVPGESDHFGQNNQLSAFTQVIGPARTLLLSADETNIEHLLPALRQAGLVVDVAAPSDAPVNMARLAAYKSVVIANVPAAQLSQAQMNLLDQFVSDLGGGLVMIGGPESYAPGGYYRTPLEETLPVEMQIKDQRRLPQLTIAYLIDRSGSMGQIGRSGVPNLELAKRAISLSLGLLQPRDRAAVGTFDTGGAWVVPFQQVHDAQSMIAMTNTLRSGGGTDILAGLRLVERDIVDEPSQLKHLILLTDGGANPTGLVELTDYLNEYFDVSLSAIGIGRSPAPILQRMAEAGDGNYYTVADVEQIPLIFAQETVLASRSYIVEEDFQPRVTGSSAILDGIDNFPPLRGYVATTPKAAAARILSGDEPFSDPVLAAWQYGLGRAVAWTSDASARWAKDWVAWDDFSRFWGQVVNWSVNAGANSNLETRIVLEDDGARIIVDARDDDGQFLDGLLLDGAALNPGGESLRLPLQQTAPGLYEARFDPKDEGAYFLTINGGAPDGGDPALTDLKGWALSYSPEYIPGGGDERLLRQLAEISGGRDLSDMPGEVFAHDMGARVATTDIWDKLALLALLLLPFDIALRRLIITRSDLRRGLALLRSGSGRGRERTARMQSLLDARGRSRDATNYGETIRLDPSPGDAPMGVPGAATRQLEEQPADPQNLGAQLLRKRGRRSQ